MAPPSWDVVILYYIVIELKNHWLRLVFLHEDTTSILKCHAIVALRLLLYHGLYTRDLRQIAISGSTGTRYILVQCKNVIRKMLDIPEERFDRALKHLVNSGLIDIITDDENFYIRSR